MRGWRHDDSETETMAAPPPAPGVDVKPISPVSP